MARPLQSSQQRSLSLTEELERLEQSITLTLQQIDHNFSRAHRIVTSSILPVVEQYAEHSRDVWEGSKFWKQFFEASANVSLSGYEDQQQTELQEETVTDQSDQTTPTTLETSESYETPHAQQISNDSIQDIDLSNLTLSPVHSTPRAAKTRDRKGVSPHKSTWRNGDESAMSANPQTPVRQTSSLLDDVAMTPEDSPELQRESTLQRQYSVQKRSDPILHNVLDRTYRIQATPITTQRVRGTKTKAPMDSALESSPLAPPELHAEVFDSPVRRELTQQINQPRVPGVSVLTPGRVQPVKRSNVWDSDDEDEYDELTGMPHGASPPKTMSFHVPQSRLLKTPAREASKQIVDNILASAGVGRGAGEESEDLEGIEASYYDDMEDSPSVVRKAVVEDETF